VDGGGGRGKCPTPCKVEGIARGEFIRGICPGGMPGCWISSEMIYCIQVQVQVY